MACFIPFNERNLDLSFFILRPTIVVVDHLLESLKHFSSCTLTLLGSIHSAIFKSIHGNLVVWYGAWIKRSCDEDRESLIASLLSMLSNNVSNMAIVVEHGFYNAYAGEARDGTPAAKFFNGDTISLHSISFSTPDIDTRMSDFSYACLAIFKDRFLKMEGAKAGVCLKSQRLCRVCGVLVWRSLQSCYSYILNEDYRRSVLPYLDGLSIDIKYDIFKVVYVSGEDNALNNQFCPPHKMLEISKGVEEDVIQDSNNLL